MQSATLGPWKVDFSVGQDQSYSQHLYIVYLNRPVLSIERRTLITATGAALNLPSCYANIMTFHTSYVSLQDSMEVFAKEQGVKADDGRYEVRGL